MLKHGWRFALRSLHWLTNLLNHSPPSQLDWFTSMWGGWSRRSVNELRPVIGCLHCVRPRSDDVRRRVGGTESAVFHLICFLISGVAEKPASTLASSSTSNVICHWLVFSVLHRWRRSPPAACSRPGFSWRRSDTLPNTRTHRGTKTCRLSKTPTALTR